MTSSFRLPPRAFAPIILLAMMSLLAEGIQAQKWTHRYPQVEGYGHHVYLEGYELPTLATGVLDPAPSPDGRELAFASRGWIWLLELETGVARRLTQGPEMDFRPVWAPDGEQLALVRDDGSEIWVVVVDAESGVEVLQVRSPAIDLDPAFSPDGRFLYYSSAREGTLDIWRLELDSGLDERITAEGGIQLRPQPHPDGIHLLYLSKAGGRDRVLIRNLESAEDRVLLETSTASQARPALSPDGRTVAVNWPQAEEWELQLVDVATPTLPIFLTRGEGLPLTPAWSLDGRTCTSPTRLRRAPWSSAGSPPTGAPRSP
jgi:TolB protein